MPSEDERRELLESPDAMRAHVLDQLRAQGFEITGTAIRPPSPRNKDVLRDLHASAVAHKIDRSRGRLERHEDRLLSRVATGRDIDVTEIAPRLIEVRRGSEDELLFRYAALHWSIPVSSGYGRRLRFLLVDDSHDSALMGIIGLGDPVYSLGVRDRWIQWTPQQRRRSLHRVMDAFVLGAVPPYNMLLVGKFIAMAVTSSEVRERADVKYGQRVSRISSEARSGGLALITTSSALGRSSVYNRLSIANRRVALSVGYTAGYGEFHFSDGLYDIVTEYAHRHCEPTAKRSEWGVGFRNRREVVKKALQHMGLPADDLLRHGVRREVFVLPLGSNSREALADETELSRYDDSLDDLYAAFRARWLIPRSQRDERWRTWEPGSWRLWSESAAGRSSSTTA